MKQHKKPCATCPFSRTNEPGYLGGSDVTVYIGQAYGPFLLHCHEDPAYKASTSQMPEDTAHCAGAAIFRANIGVAERIPPILLHLGSDTNRVFANAAELLAHHQQIPVSWAEYLLTLVTPQHLMTREYTKKEAVHVRIKR